MSWIKKVLSFLQQEEEPGAVKKQPLQKKDGPLHKSHDLDTKMVYQYPKGAFRFPIIPDEQNVRVKNEQKEEAKRSQPAPDYEADRKLYEREYDEKKKVKREVSNRPFTPTEVPSPIYGFEKRPDKKKIPEIEYELPASIKKAKQTDNVVSFLQQKNTETSEITPLPNENSNDQAEEAVKEPDTGTAGESPLNAALDVQLESVQSFQKVDQVEAAEKVRSIEESQNQIEEAEFEESDNAELEAAAAVAEELETEEAEVEPLVVAAKSEQDAEAPAHANTEADLVTEEEPLLPEKAADLSVKEEEAEKADHKAQAEPKKEKKAGALPFNVLMLKQDRRKAEDRGAAKKQTFQQTAPQVTKIDDQQPEVKTEEAAAVIPSATLETNSDEPAYYAFPSMNLLMPPVHAEVDQNWLDEQAALLDETLASFNVNAKVKHVTQGPSVTRFEIFPEKGVKVSKITSLTDDIKLSLAARDIRMEAPIPGKMAVGIEIPNASGRPVALKEILDHKAFHESTATLPIALGLDIEGQPVVTDIGKMPHGLIAGATGSGKSVCINSILVSLLYHSSPDDLRLLLIDPKMVELAPYNHIPHLVSPVITDVKAATAALKWAVEEMERRYQLFAHAGVRDISRYNQKAKESRQFNQKLPYLVIVIDELADLMMMSPADVEEAICRIAQKARACGIHLLIATQRPSVDVITGLIKANVPTRVAFSVSSQVDSRTIIDTSGADRLLGKGDMLFLGNGASKPVRLQGTFVSDEEIDSVVAHVRKERDVNYLFHQEELLAKVEIQEEEDELLMDACELVVSHGGASTSLLQRQFRIGYNRAARLIDLMEKQGWISEAKGSKPRDVLMTNEDLQSLQDTGTSQ
ncbi:DNA translocase FtsK [Jeotgalibacillus proteolyticus]|uniref:DNA translocase FtsK n=1 Tax=Jeotgalibacillus proteolyticus TaxID=2082395 RepID=A0A2S5GFL4_9BACL|nr:DNA translocase FtsK [Jeotgalibacillus proteolyticus]PPA71673.1 DNA translocase FtsK [Jeotgalibacillus proteolyticus]